MKIGIVIAIVRELKAFLDSDFETKILNIGQKEVYEFQVNGNDIYAIRSGFGQIDAAAATQLLITKFDCEVILNFGVTGALDRNLKVEDLFVVTKAINYDYDVSTVDPVKLHQYEEFPDEFIPLDGELVALAKELYPTLREAVVASGERFVATAEDKTELGNLGCNICDMEIAAIARTAIMNGARVLSIKCISDTFDGDGGDFNENVNRSSKIAFKLIEDLLNKI